MLRPVRVFLPVSRERSLALRAQGREEQEGLLWLWRSEWPHGGGAPLQHRGQGEVQPAGTSLQHPQPGSWPHALLPPPHLGFVPQQLGPHVITLAHESHVAGCRLPGPDWFQTASPPCLLAASGSSCPNAEVTSGWGWPSADPEDGGARSSKRPGSSGPLPQLHRPRLPLASCCEETKLRSGQVAVVGAAEQNSKSRQSPWSPSGKRGAPDDPRGLESGSWGLRTGPSPHHTPKAPLYPPAPPPGCQEPGMAPPPSEPGLPTTPAGHCH